MEALLPSAARERIHTLWDELTDFNASDVDGAVHHLLDVVAGLVGAQNAYWLGVVRLVDEPGDALCGWRPRVIRYLKSTPQDEAFAKQAIRNCSRGRFDESSATHARQSGCFRAPLRRELVSPSWFEEDFYKSEIEPRGIVDTLFVIFPVNAWAEAYYGFHRIGDAGLFSEEDRQVAVYAMRGLKWFHRQVMLSHGLLVASSPLSPIERRVLALLLTERSEKEIAVALNHTTKTTHTYITEIFRRFNVSGRAGLTALWLGAR